MKKIALLLALFIAPLAINAQNFWSSFENDNDVSSVVITKKMFKLLAKIDLDTDDQEVNEFMDLVENLDNIKIFTTDNSSIAVKMSSSVSSYIDGSKGLSELMRVKDDGNNIKFYSREGKNENYVSELLMFLEGTKDGKNQTVVMSITGNIDLKQISKLTKNLDVPGADAIKSLEKKNR
ncbi:MAG: hypothetical protein ACI825_000475 [Planctomycetota bacterium]|jgi:hypothetical protein|uniref:DUF4252 domain-containing protein n=1 Tax=Patiriisocius sp. Uisw_047 TaxID=3230969 RepID=UPI0039E8FB12